MNIVCTPPSGSTFPIGKTTVSCSASDASGDSASATFTVDIWGPDLQVYLLLSFQPLNPNIAGSVNAKLQSVLSSLAIGNTTAACNQMNAYINEVQAQSGKKIPVGDAGVLLTAAQQIRAVIGCP